MRFFSSLGQHRILGGALVLAVTQFGASVAGLLRDRILAGTFPGLDVTDVYIAAFRPSDLLFQVCIMAGYSVALVPLLAEHKAHGRQGEMHRLLNGVVGLAAMVFGAVALVLALLLPQVAPLLVQFQGPSLDLYIRFGQLALFTNFLFVFGNAYGQYLITIQKYWIYGITPILYTLGTIFGTLYLVPEYGPLGPMLGTLAGAVLYVLLRFAAIFYAGYRLRFAGIWHPDIREIVLLMLPRTLALGALQLELLFFDTIASGLPGGSVTINAYARNFQSVAVGVAGIALAQSVFSLLSQAAAKKEFNRFWIYLRKGIAILLLLTIPGAIVLVLATPIAASLVNLTHVLPLFSICLALYAVSIPFESLNHLLLRGFYATKNTLIPSLFSMLNGAVAVGLAWFLVPRYGVFSLAIGFTAGQVIQLLGLGLFLRKRVDSLE